MRQLESFFWGIIAALGALALQLLLFIGASLFPGAEISSSFSEIFMLPQFVILFAFTEEAFKYLIISKRVEAYSLEKSFIVNSWLVGLGFVATEFWLLANAAALPEGRILIELATVHLGTSGIIGYLVATKNPKKVSTFLFAVILVSILHASYNFLIQNREPLQNYSIYVLLGLLIFFNLLNFLRISRKLAQD